MDPTKTFRPFQRSQQRCSVVTFALSLGVFGGWLHLCALDASIEMGAPPRQTWRTASVIIGIALYAVLITFNVRQHVIPPIIQLR